MRASACRSRGATPSCAASMRRRPRCWWWRSRSATSSPRAASRTWCRGRAASTSRPSGRARAARPRQGRPIWLYAGRVAIEKNIKAFLDLDLPGTKWVVGGGPQLKELKRRYKDVQFFGSVDTEELSRRYAEADCFVFPSRTDTFGLVMVEALASGVPVAGYPVPGPLDVVTVPNVGAIDEDLRTACLAAVTGDPAGLPAPRRDLHLGKLRRAVPRHPAPHPAQHLAAHETPRASRRRGVLRRLTSAAAAPIFQGSSGARHASPQPHHHSGQGQGRLGAVPRRHPGREGRQRSGVPSGRCRPATASRSTSSIPRTCAPSTTPSWSTTRSSTPRSRKIKKAGIAYFADPDKSGPGEINHHWGGRGVYFEDPNGHLLELITKPYGKRRRFIRNRLPRHTGKAGRGKASVRLPQVSDLKFSRPRLSLAPSLPSPAKRERK